MALIKDFIAGTSHWLRSHRFAEVVSGPPHIDEDGLISETIIGDSIDPESAGGSATGPVTVRSLPSAERRETLEKLQDGFNELVGQLQSINKHLDQQLAQHGELMRRLQELPEVLDSFPAVVQSQQRLTEQLLSQLNASSAKDRQLLATLEKVPAETARQNELLVSIDHQLAAAAEIDVQMADGFSRFNHSLHRLNQTSSHQTESILQMSETFAASDRHLKHVLMKQNKRFMWMFGIAVGVCAAAILALTGIIISLAW